jgi:uncharacterized membrane protein
MQIASEYFKIQISGGERQCLTGTIIQEDANTGDRKRIRHRPYGSNMRRSFLRGLAIIIPIAITVWVLWFIFQFIDGIASPFYEQIGLNIPGLGFITAIILIILRYFLTLSRREGVLQNTRTDFFNLPLARSVYSGARELINAFSLGQKGKTFREVCMVEYPRKGIYSIGFKTNELTFETRTEVNNGWRIFISRFRPTRRRGY